MCETRKTASSYTALTTMTSIAYRTFVVKRFTEKFCQAVKPSFHKASVWIFLKRKVRPSIIELGAKLHFKLWKKWAKRCNNVWKIEVKDGGAGAWERERLPEKLPYKRSKIPKIARQSFAMLRSVKREHSAQIILCRMTERKFLQSVPESAILVHGDISPKKSKEEGADA